MRLNHLRDRASEKGHKKEYPFLINLHFRAWNDVCAPSSIKAM